MTAHAQISEEEHELIESVNNSLQRIRVFFKDNEIGESVGSSLFNEFLSFTFNGGASIGTSEDETTISWEEAPEVQEWLENIRPLVTVITTQSKEIVQDIFSAKEQEFPHREMLKEGFLDALFGSDQALSNETRDGTASVIACMVASGVQETIGTKTIH